MKTLLLTSFLIILSANSFGQVSSGGSGPGNSSVGSNPFTTENTIFECYGAALNAAKLIDELNFPYSDRSGALVDAEVQKSKRARIAVSFGESTNRKYTIRIRKNRTARLIGDGVVAEAGCFVESVN
ncbi:MAG: hypothetical protein ACOVP4_09950 [Bacteriovoracaceae bacterium]|jgi:hypothetical protein